MEEVGSPLQSYHRVALDTVIFIYFLESDSEFSVISAKVLNYIEQGSLSAGTSVLAISELTAGPHKYGLTNLASVYEARLAMFPNLQIVDVNRAIARAAARIRGRYGFPLPDSIHLATAVLWGAETFITNDRRLQQFEEVQVTLLSDFVH